MTENYNINNKVVLVVGGAGYIGSHTIVQLVEAGAVCVVLDNLVNSDYEVINRIEIICGKPVVFIQGDVRDRLTLRKIFNDYDVTAVFHFAGLKAVCESAKIPLEYYDVNVYGSIVLFEEMVRSNVNILIFSSSATVYGNSVAIKYTEILPCAPVNVYGRTKLYVENILIDLKSSIPSFRVALLRYFNPVGCHSTGLIGEDPKGTPNNLMPYIAQVALGIRNKLFIFGNDYPTPDGTCIRDFIHVEDLASGHLSALQFLINSKNPNELLTLNLGTGKPHSVLEMIGAFNKASGINIPFEFADRRVGDLPVYFADPSLAFKTLGWKAKRDINSICRDTWNRISSQ